jgi:hypothetical protein
LGAGGDGGNGVAADETVPGGEGGRGATKTEPGKGGAGGVAEFTGESGDAGTLGAGGSGKLGLAGGGGGGGLYGGGGGGFGGAAGSGAEGGAGGGGAGSSFVAPSGSNPGFEEDTTGNPEVTIVYVPPPCTTAVGRAFYLKRFESGQLNINNNLSTNLAEPQRLIVGKNTGEIRFRLTKLEEAFCRGPEGEREFSGEGQAVKFNVGGYHLSFRIYEQGGKFFFESHLTKEGAEIEATGGPLRTGSEKIF